MNSNLNSLQPGSFALTSTQSQLDLSQNVNTSNQNSDPRILSVVGNALTPNTSLIPFSDEASDETGSINLLALVSAQDSQSGTRRSHRLRVKRAMHNALEENTSNSSSSSKLFDQSTKKLRSGGASESPTQTSSIVTHKRGRQDVSVAQTSTTNLSATTANSTLPLSFDEESLPLDPSAKKLRTAAALTNQTSSIPIAVNPIDEESRLAPHQLLWQDLSTAMSSPQPLGDLRGKIDEYLKCILEIATEHPDKKSLLDNLCRLKVYVQAHPDIFDVASTSKQIDRCILEIDLQRWIADPTATGEKREASRKILAAFKYDFNYLNLSNFELNRLPEFIYLLSRVLTLNLNSNNLTEFPKSLSRMEHLQSILLRVNKLTRLPEISGNPQLRELDLFHNQIKKLPESLGNWTKLRFLNLSFNTIEELPESIKNLTHLYLLSLRDNTKLCEIPSSLFNRMYDLHILDIQDTGVSPVVSSFILDEIANKRKQRFLAGFHDILQSWKQQANSQFELSGIEVFSDNEKVQIGYFLYLLENSRFFLSESAKCAESVCSKIYVALHNQQYKERFLTMIDRALKDMQGINIKTTSFSSFFWKKVGQWYNMLDQVLPPSETLAHL